MRRVACIGLLTAAVSLGVAGPASASTAWVSQVTNTLFYQAAPGETNALEISDGPAGITLVDTGAVIVPGNGCIAVSANEVLCEGASVLGRLGDGNDTGAVVLGDRVHGIVGGTGDDVLTVCAGCTGSLHGDDGDDHLVGGDIRGTLDGGAGNDVIEGGDGEDFIAGDKGNDLIAAGAGADTILPGLGNDTVDGGADRDTLRYATATRPMLVDLKLGTATGDGPDIFVGIENVFGSRFSDDLRGDGQINRLSGGDRGNDVLRGRGGRDFLFGGIGRDIIYSRDGERDDVRGGPDWDRAHVDRGLDLVRDVERFF
jgi:Ca2+-binding RTX toxin-like protein